MGNKVLLLEFMFSTETSVKDVILVVLQYCDHDASVSDVFFGIFLSCQLSICKRVYGCFITAGLTLLREGIRI